MITETGKDVLLDEALKEITISLHTGDPGNNGAFELDGAGYKREAVRFAPARAGVAALVAEASVTIPPRSTITHYGMWKGGRLMFKGPLPRPEEFVGPGLYTVRGIQVSLS